MSKTQQINALQRLTVGQPTTIKASTWNAFVQHVESSNNDDLPPVKSNDNNTVILCKNVSGVDILPFFCVKVNSATLANVGSVLGNSYNATPTIVGGAYPMPREEDFLGITQERINNGECGYVLIHGITPLRYGNMFIAPTYAEEQANTYYLSPDIYTLNAYPVFTCTTTPAKIRLLKYNTNESYATTYPVVYLDNGVAYPKPYFNYTKTSTANHVSLTFDSFECDILDYNTGTIYSKTVPQITISNLDQIWVTRKYNEYLVYNKHDDTFNIFASLSTGDEFFCQIGYQNYTRFVCTCFNKPLLLPRQLYMTESNAFNITYSLSDGTITIGQGNALIVGTGISKSSSNTTLSLDASGNAFVAGSRYHVYAEYDLTSDTFAIKAHKHSGSNGRLKPSSSYSYALLGDVVFGSYKNQMFKGSYLPMFIDLNMRNPT